MHVYVVSLPHVLSVLAGIDNSSVMAFSKITTLDGYQSEKRKKNLDGRIELW